MVIAHEGASSCTTGRFWPVGACTRHGRKVCCCRPRRTGPCSPCQQSDTQPSQRHRWDTTATANDAHTRSITCPCHRAASMHAGACSGLRGTVNQAGADAPTVRQAAQGHTAAEEARNNAANAKKHKVEQSVVETSLKNALLHRTPPHARAAPHHQATLTAQPAGCTPATLHTSIISAVNTPQQEPACCLLAPYSL